MSDIQTITEQAARDARDVFESYGSKAREAIDYMEQLIYAAMRKTEPATDAAHVNETLKSEHDAGNVLTEAAQSRAPFFFDRYINEAQINDACMWYRHDFGLLQGQEREMVRFEAKEWLRAWGKAIPATDARAEALKEAAAVAAKFDSDGMYGAAAIHDAILALAPTTTTR